MQLVHPCTDYITWLMNLFLFEHFCVRNLLFWPTFKPFHFEGNFLLLAAVVEELVQVLSSRSPHVWSVGLGDPSKKLRHTCAGRSGSVQSRRTESWPAPGHGPHPNNAKLTTLQLCIQVSSAGMRKTREESFVLGVWITLLASSTFLLS